MKTETKLLLGLTAAAFIPVMAAMALLRPGPFPAAVVVVCGAVAVLVIWRVLTGISPGHGGSSPGMPATPSTWPQRTGDPDKLVDRLVSTIEEFIADMRGSKAAPENGRMRKELHQRLSYLVEEVTGLPVGIEALEVTVLLSDLRGFSVVTESYSSREVVEMLNRYLARMYEIIYRHGGTVDKFMGDSIMALFGAPVNRLNDVQHAVCCAVEMQIAMDAFNKENEELGMPHQYMGIGINTGQVVAGKIGSDLHSEYTVIGEEVNLASRIEAYTLRGQILLSHRTYSRVRDLVRVENPIYVSVKGRREPTPLYELLAVGEPYNLRVPEREARRSLRVDVNIAFQFQICEGKAVSSGTYEGRILNLSTGGMFACTFAEIEPWLNIRFKLDFRILGVQSGDIYGKILRVKKEAELYEMNIEFTAINPTDRNAVKELVDRIIQRRFEPIA